MAISLLYNPVPTRLFEADGDFASGAKAYFYLARTTTPLLAYTDSPLAVPHPWPVVADAFGLLPPVYLATGIEFKVRIEDQHGSLLYAADGIENSSGSGGSLPVDSYTKVQSDATFVNVDGDVMTGDVAINKPAPAIYLNKPAAGTHSSLVGQLGGKARWHLSLGNDSAESGGNAGSDFAVNRYDDAGGYLASPLLINRATGATYLYGGLSVTGALNVTGGAAVASLNVTGVTNLAGATSVAALTATGGQWLPQATSGTVATAATAGLEIRSTSAATAATIAFHRPGAFAVYFGLDTDNQLAFGGWSLGATRRVLWDSGNFNPAAYLPLGGGTVSARTNFYGGADVSVYGHSTGDNHAIYGKTTNGGAAGVAGYNYNSTLYTYLGYSSYALYATGLARVSGDLIVGDDVNITGVLTSTVTATTGNSPNVWQNGTAGNYARFTSSLAYKTALEPMWDEIGDLVLQMQPIFYRSNELTIDRPDWSWYSFAAEELAVLDPRFAQWGREVKRDAEGEPIPIISTVDSPDGKGHTDGYELEDEEVPQSIQLSSIVAALVNLVQRQEARIAALEAAQ